MAIPRAVKLQGDLADQILATRQNQGGGQETGQQPNPPAQQTPQATPQQAQPQAPQPPAQPAVQAPPAGAHPGNGSWEQRYKTLQGIHQADRQRLSNEIAQRDDQIRVLTDRLTDLEAKVNSAPQGGNAQAAQDIQNMSWSDLGITDEQVDEMGEDLLSVLRTMATNVAKRATGEVSQRLDAYAQQSRKSRDEEFQSAVFSEVPDFDAINHDPEFHAWLRERDGLSYKTRHENLRDAYEHRDATAVIGYFNAFKESSGGARYVAPDSFGGPRPDTSGGEGPEPWTRREISAFYADVAKGKFKNREDEMQRIEQSIVAAQKAGRILPG